MLLFFLLLGAVRAAKIGVFVAAFSESQVLFNVRLAEELAKEHDVVLIRFDVQPNTTTVANHPNVKEIRLKAVDPSTFAAMAEAEQRMIFHEPGIEEYHTLAVHFDQAIEEMCKNMLNKDFLEKLKKEKIDFALHHHLDVCQIGVGHHVGIESWGWTMSSPLSRTILSRIGHPVLLSVFPGILTDASNKMTFLQRVQNIGIEMALGLAQTFNVYKKDAMFREAFGPDFPALNSLIQKGKLVLANSVQQIEFPLPTTSQVVFVGGLGQKERKKLEKPFDAFVGGHHIVIISFGTVADSAKMPQAWKDAFRGLFVKNPSVRFIWKYDGKEELPPNVLASKWIPQNDLLGLEKTVAFISHGGYNSVGEAISSGTPLVVVPLFADQMRNAQLVEYRGIGIRVDKSNLSTETLHAALQAILRDKKYHQSALELHAIQSSLPVPAGSLARHALSFALAHPSFDLSVPPLPPHQLYSLDVISFFVFILFSFLYLIYRVLYCYYWSCCLMSYKEKEKIN